MTVLCWQFFVFFFPFLERRQGNSLYFWLTPSFSYPQLKKKSFHQVVSKYICKLEIKLLPSSETLPHRPAPSWLFSFKDLLHCPHFRDPSCYIFSLHSPKWPMILVLWLGVKCPRRVKTLGDYAWTPIERKVFPKFTSQWWPQDPLTPWLTGWCPHTLWSCRQNCLWMYLNV